MRETLTPRTLRLLDIQGFDPVDAEELARTAPWPRLAFALCALVGGVGTALASPAILLLLTVVAAIAALSPVHPFDLIYDLGIRHLTGTGPLPKRGLPSRMGCGLGAIFLVVTVAMFTTGHTAAGYALGAALTLVVLLAAVTDLCLPSVVYRAIFGWPRVRTLGEEG